jgi:hypothetical protein
LNQSVSGAVSNTPPNKSKKLSFNNSDLSNQDSSNHEDDPDDSFDKSSTLKAQTQITSVSVSATTSPNTSANSGKPINKHNSEKSIYFSSVNFYF